MLAIDGGSIVGIGSESRTTTLNMLVSVLALICLQQKQRLDDVLDLGDDVGLHGRRSSGFGGSVAVGLRLFQMSSM